MKTANKYCKELLKDLIFINKLEKDEIKDIEIAMTVFAKMHTKAALEAASEKAIVGWSANGDEIVINKDSILNAYSIDSIK